MPLSLTVEDLSKKTTVMDGRLFVTQNFLMLRRFVIVAALILYPK